MIEKGSEVPHICAFCKFFVVEDNPLDNEVRNNKQSVADELELWGIADRAAQQKIRYGKCYAQYQDRKRRWQRYAMGTWGSSRCNAKNLDTGTFLFTPKSS